MNKEHPRLNLWEKQPLDSDTTDVSRETSEVYDEYYVDEVDAPAALLERMRAAANVPVVKGDLMPIPLRKLCVSLVLP